MRPKPLERWFWGQRLSASAERVYWYHWEEGVKNGTWCSQVAIRIVARDCCLDTGTVSRAYQALKSLGLLRRQDPGRDDSNPFCQGTAITEVFVPRDLVARLALEPNRHRGDRAKPAREPTQAAPTRAAATPAPIESSPALSRTESQRIFGKLSPAEQHLFYVEQRARRTRMSFDTDTRLTPEEQIYVCHTLGLLASAKPNPSATAGQTETPQARGAPTTRLSILALAELRQRLAAAKGKRDSRDVDELLRQVTWSVEQGSLARWPARHAIHIALKKIRDGAWSRPFGMPAEWKLKRLAAPFRGLASPEYCGAAGL
jgi:hypothetical protein